MPKHICRCQFAALVTMRKPKPHISRLIPRTLRFVRHGLCKAVCASITAWLCAGGAAGGGETPPAPFLPSRSQLSSPVSPVDPQVHRATLWLLAQFSHWLPSRIIFFFFLWNNTHTHKSNLEGRASRGYEPSPGKPGTDVSPSRLSSIIFHCFFFSPISYSPLSAAHLPRSLCWWPALPLLSSRSQPRLSPRVPVPDSGEREPLKLSPALIAVTPWSLQELETYNVTVGATAAPCGCWKGITIESSKAWPEQIKLPVGLSLDVPSSRKPSWTQPTRMVRPFLRHLDSGLWISHGAFFHLTSVFPAGPASSEQGQEDLAPLDQSLPHSRLSGSVYRIEHHQENRR